MNRTDCINHLRAGHPMTHRVSRIIAEMLEADGTALANAEDSHLLRTLADIREALGVGATPMLDELPGLVRGMVKRIGELAADCQVASAIQEELRIVLQDYADRLSIARQAMGANAELAREVLAATASASEMLSRVKAERDELAKALLARPHCKCQKFKNWSDGQEKLPHLPGCPVALAEKIVKEAGDGR